MKFVHCFLIGLLIAALVVDVSDAIKKKKKKDDDDDRRSGLSDNRESLSDNKDAGREREAGSDDRDRKEMSEKKEASSSSSSEEKDDKKKNETEKAEATSSKKLRRHIEHAELPLHRVRRDKHKSLQRKKEFDERSSSGEVKLRKGHDKKWKKKSGYRK